METLFANMGIFLSLVTYVYFGNPFTARQVFVVTAYMQLLYTWCVFFLSHALHANAEALVSVGRIEEFLLLPESKIELELAAQSRQSKEEEMLLTKTRGIRPENSDNRSPEMVLMSRNWSQLEKNQLPEIVLRKATAAWIRNNQNSSDTGDFDFLTALKHIFQ